MRGCEQRLRVYCFRPADPRLYGPAAARVISRSRRFALSPDATAALEREAVAAVTYKGPARIAIGNNTGPYLAD